MDRLGELPRLDQIRMRGLPPQEIGIGRVGKAAGDAVRQTRAFLQSIETLGRALTFGDEGAVALVDVGGDQLGRLGVGAGQDQGRHAADIGGQARGDEIADMGRSRDQDLAAHVAALLFRGQLVLEMDAGGAGLDERLHDLEAVERSAETGFSVGDDGQEPVARRTALGMFDLVGPLEGAVDFSAQFRRRVGRVEALVGVHRPGRVVIGGDLPAGEIDRLEAGPGHLHGLVAGDRA